MVTMTLKTKPLYSESLTVKVTPKMKKTLQALAWDKDDSVCRLIRKAMMQTYPELKAAK